MPTIKRIEKRPWQPKITNRNNQHDKFYDSPAWRKKRKQVLQREPLCRICKAIGIISAATMVDHIIPIKQGGAPLDDDNLQPLDNKCHAIKSALEGKGL